MENIIKIHLKEKENYKNTYNEEILSYKLSNYILEETKGISTKQNIINCFIFFIGIIFIMINST